MWRFIRTNKFRALSNIIIAVFALTLMSAVYAQGVSGIMSTQKWAVLDFDNKTPEGGRALGKQASDAVALELNKSGKFNVSLRTEVDEALKNLELTPPLNKLGYLRLGTELDVEGIATGAVEKAEMVTKKKGEVVFQVVISIRVTDVASGLQINGAYGVGESIARPSYGGDKDILINEALSLAAFDAVKTIKSFTLPQATVLNTSGKNVLLNHGSREGIKVGMRMVVLRGKEEVGVIKIFRVEAAESEGIVETEIKGIAPSDKARAIFELYEFTSSKAGSPSKAGPVIKSSKMDVGKILLPLAVVALVAFGVGGSGGTDTGVSDFVARSNADSLGNPTIELTWDTNMFAQGPNIRKGLWQVYRDDYNVIDENGNPTPVAVVSGRNKITDTTAIRTLNYGSPPPEGTEDQDLVEVEDVPGITEGRSYTYSLRLFYRRSELDSPSGDVALWYLSDEVLNKGTNGNIGQATAVTPPTITSPLKNKPLTNGQFSWNGVLGADSYIIVVSDNATFRKGSRNWKSDPIPGSTGPMSYIAANVDWASLFPNARVVDGDRQLYVKIGSRKLDDDPGPVGDAFGNRYVFSQANMFTIPDEPPPPPGN